MVGRKTKVRRFESPSSRQVTFCKRSGDLLKKAQDMAVMYDAEVGVIVFSSKGRLFQFASPNMERVLECYTKSCGDPKTINNKRLADIVGTESLSQSTNSVTMILRRAPYKTSSTWSNNTIITSN